MRFQFSGPPQKRGFCCACVLCLPRLSGPGSQRLGRPFPEGGGLFPPRPQRAPPVGSQGVFRQDSGPVCRVGGVASLGLSLPLSPPPASYLQRGWGGSSLEFLSPIVLRTAGGVFRPVNFSLALPQFKKSSLRLLSGPLAGPHPKECRWLLSVPPPLAGGGCGRLGYFSAGSCF